MCFILKFFVAAFSESKNYTKQGESDEKKKKKTQQMNFFWWEEIEIEIFQIIELDYKFICSVLIGNIN